MPLEFKPQQKATAKTSYQLDNSEGEDSDEGDAPKVAPKKVSPKKGGATTTTFDPIIIQTNRETSRPRQNTEADKKTTFDPVVINTNREPTRPRIVPNKP
ncbi:MAG: hypothetical protein HC846_10155 [Blastocatellia bacterium]|nr:hypothetical protein [Blastocatellia bacterium]